MYKAFDSRWENESKDDEGSLSSSSFWTDRESEGEDKDCVEKENRANERKPEEDHKDVKESFLIGGDKKKRVKEMLQENELGKEKHPEEDESEVKRECFIDDENKNRIEITRTRQDVKEEESEGEDDEESGEEEEECGKEEEESGEEEEEEESGEEEEEESGEEEEEGSEEEEEESRDEKEELCEQQTGNEKEEEDDATESEDGEKGKELDEEEESELCEQGERNKKEEEESEESKEEEHMSEEEKESSGSAENTEENEETKAQSDDSEGEKDQESEVEESFSKEDSKSEEKCTGELSECEEKKESLPLEESTSGSGEENGHFSEEGEENEGANVCCIHEDSEGTEGKLDGGKSLLNEERKINSESEGSENSKQRVSNNEEEDSSTKDRTEENPNSDEERNCGNEYDEDIGKSRPEADECDNWMEEVKRHNSGEEDDEVSKGGSEEEEEREWFFSEPVEEKEACDQDRKSWASDDDYVTIASGHSQKDEEESYNMIPAWEQECEDVQQTKGTRDVYDEDFHESLGSPAASVLTSGYGTYRPDSPKDGDPEEVDYRDDCTLAGLEEESESILDARDYEDDSCPAWLTDNQALETSDGQAPAESPDASQDVTVCSHDGSEDDGHRSPDFPNREHQTDLCRSPTENDTGTQHGGSENVAYFTDGWEVEDLRDSLDHPFNLRPRRGILQKRPEEKQYIDGYDDSKKRREKRVRAYTGCLGVLHWLKGFTFVVFRGMAVEETEERCVFSFFHALEIYNACMFNKKNTSIYYC